MEQWWQGINVMRFCPLTKLFFTFFSFFCVVQSAYLVTNLFDTHSLYPCTTYLSMYVQIDIHQLVQLMDITNFSTHNICTNNYTQVSHSVNFFVVKITLFYYFFSEAVHEATVFKVGVSGCELRLIVAGLVFRDSGGEIRGCFYNVKNGTWRSEWRVELIIQQVAIGYFSKNICLQSLEAFRVCVQCYRTDQKF